MKSFAVLISILAMSQDANAQAADCKSIPDPGPRLACYDAANPPAASAARSTTTAAPLTTRPVSTTIDQPKYVDAISAEDVLMNARLRNICRGC